MREIIDNRKQMLWTILVLYTHLNTSNPSDYIMDNTFLKSNPLRISVEEDIFLPNLLILSQYRSTWFQFMSDHSITDHMVPHDLHRIPDSISEDLSILKVVICLFWSSNIALVIKYLL